MANAAMSGADIMGMPLFAEPDAKGGNVAVSQADGTYALFDWRYTGGTVRGSAMYGGQVAKGVAYEVNPQDAKSPGLRYARHVATTNLTFPADETVQPPTTSAITVVRELESREVPLVDGSVETGTPIGVRSVASTDAPIQSVTINGESFRAEPGTEDREWRVPVARMSRRSRVYTP